MSAVSVFQPKGKAHIQYIHRKAMEIFRNFYKSDESYRIDAIQAAMREHRSYCISAHNAAKKAVKPEFTKGTWWKERGVWKPL